MGGSSQQLIKQVASRKRLASLAKWAYRSVLVLAGVYTVVFLLAWISIIPSWFGEGSGAVGPLSVLIVPLLAALIALIVHRGVTPQEAAHAVDEKMGTKDLYLTASMLESAPGEFAPLVNKSVESDAPRVQAAVVVPFSPWERLSHVVLVLALLLVGAAFMNPFDPFKVDAERQQVAQRIKKLQEEKIAAKKRIEVLKSQDLDAKTSKPVANAEAELKKTFAQMKKEDKEANLKKLEQQQKKIGDQWNKAKEKSLKSTSRDQMAQRLGNKSQKTQQWKKDIQQGKSDSMKKELEEIKKLAEDMKNEESEIKKNEMKQEMEKRVQEMNDFAKSNANSKELGDSLQKALEQLSQSGDQQTAEEANESLQEQLEQSQQELEKMAQSIRDQKELEKMLQTIQQAKQANEKEGLDGQQTQSCQNMSDYQKLFEKMGGGSGQGQGDGQSADNGSGSSETENGQPGTGQGQGQGQGQQANGQGGTGGVGQGRGGVTPEDPSQKTTFKSEKSKSALKAGKVLLEWKTQEEAKPGTAKLDYQQEVKRVKAGASEAILQEEIPPGYHDAIKKYFDSYEEKAGSKPAPKPAGKSDGE